MQSDSNVLKCSRIESKKIYQAIDQSVISSQTSMANKICVICYCRLSSGMVGKNQEQEITVHVLTCKHAFHLRCFSQWVEVQKVCPVCRTGTPNDISLSKS